MVPDFSFVAVKELINKGLIGGEFRLNECEDVGFYIFHLHVKVKYVGTVVLKADAVDILEVDPKNLITPDGLR
jgi:hypothetical protein